jgi:hypothetical protein
VKGSRFSTVQKVNFVSVIIGGLIGLLFGLPVIRKLFPGSLLAQVIVVMWLGGFGYICGYFFNLIYVSRKYRQKK